jgi:hypothetical protein
MNDDKELSYEEYHTPEHCNGCAIQAKAGLWLPMKPKTSSPEDKLK